MLTEDQQKEEHLLEPRGDTEEGEKGLTYHACSDVTRWNQNWTAHKTSLAILTLELPTSFESKLLSLSSSFSLKFVTLNSSLIKKYKKMEEKKGKIGKDLTGIVRNIHLKTVSIRISSRESFTTCLDGA